jgi:hypothetical protein
MKTGARMGFIAKKLRIWANKLVGLTVSYQDALQKKIRQIQQEIADLDKETSRLDHEIDIQRAKLGGVNAAQQNNAAIDKQIRVLENRLEKVIGKGLIRRLSSSLIRPWLSISVSVN